MMRLFIEEENKIKAKLLEEQYKENLLQQTRWVTSFPFFSTMDGLMNDAQREYAELKRQRLLDDRRENAELLGDSMELALPLSRFMTFDGAAESKEAPAAPSQIAAVTPFMLLLAQRREPKLIASSSATRPKEDPRAGGYRLEDYAAKSWTETALGLAMHGISIDPPLPISSLASRS